MFKNISSPSEYLELINQGAIAIDVRTEQEYTDSKIPKIQVAFDWNNGEFHDKFDELDSEKTYIFVCRSGNRSMQACMYLASNGFTDLYNLEGGMINWEGDTD